MKSGQKFTEVSRSNTYLEELENLIESSEEKRREAFTITNTEKRDTNSNISSEEEPGRAEE